MQVQKLLFLFYTESKSSADYANRSGEKYNKTGYVRINVALRRVRVTILAVEKQCVLHMYVCIRSCVASSARAPYCHLWPVRINSILTYYLIRGTTVDKKLLNIKCVLILSSTFI